MTWAVGFAGEFKVEFDTFSELVQDELLLNARLLEEFGPQLGRPHVDTLKGSDYANMKELRFKAESGVWRVAFAFDPKRNAILLVAGDKSGRFYKRLIEKADRRYKAHLQRTGE
ncbi:MAG: addiction module toxin RelE [Gemmatimonadetes bacterium]|nr:addiction module toxin RelE [Gemmatimonadota bacterium]